MTFGWLLLAAAAVAAPTSQWRVAGTPGAVTSVTGIVKTGGRIVGDGMVSDPDLRASERAGLTFGHTPRGSCAWAAAVRPFTRLRRFARDGRLLWEWHVNREQQAVRLLANSDGDCLSPDGGRLLVTAHAYQPDDPGISPLGPAVVAVDHRPRFVDAIGARTHQRFESPRRTYLVGWQRGKPATLLFDVASETKFDKAGDPEVVPDSADLTRSR